MKRTYLVSIIALIVIVMILSAVVYYKNIQAREVLTEVAYRNITYNIVQLEGAIMFQMEKNWNEPSNVIEKIEDIIEGIYLTQETGTELKILSNEDKRLLERLHRYFAKYPEYSGFPNHEVNENEVKSFEKLRSQLREVGWGYHISYSSSWDIFIEKASILVNKGV